MLVLAASGGVGSFAVQFAKAKGIKVIGTCGTRNVEFVKGLGADVVVDYTKEDVVSAVRAHESQGVDVVFDCVGGESGLQGIGLVKEGGVIVSIANFTVAEDAKKQGKRGTAFLVNPRADELESIAGLFDEGKVKVGKLQILGLSEAGQAWQLSESGRVQGKLVLSIGATMKAVIQEEYGGSNVQKEEKKEERRRR